MAEDVDAWAGDERAQAAADARARERWLRRQAAESATLVGVLVELAERAALTVIALGNGRRHRGVITSVGRDHAVLDVERGGRVLIAVHAITSVRPTVPVAVGEAGAARPAPTARLADTLADVAAERRRVVLGLAGGELVTGELRSVAADVVTVRADGDAALPVHVAVAAIYDASFFGSG